MGAKVLPSCSLEASIYEFRLPLYLEKQDLLRRSH